MLRDALPAGFKLHWYELESVLGQGGFGITYLGQDTNLGQPVAVKEYLPNEFAVREGDSTVQPRTGEQGDIYKWGLDRFLKEARTLAQFKHPNIVRVLSVFEHNNTAYMVMEYERGSDLSVLFKRGSLREESELLAVVLPVLDGLKLVHQAGFIHRDIKPANIYLREHDNTPVLLDFGSARHALGEQTKTMTSLVSLGYAPFEQYQDAEGKQGPWTDIYSLGATLYCAVTGQTPIEAMTRGNAIINHDLDPYKPVRSLIKNGYSEHFLNAIDNALAFRFAERPQTLETWAEMLQGKLQAPRIVLDEPAEPTDPDATVIAPRPRTSRSGATAQRTTRAVTRPTGPSQAAKPNRRLLLYAAAGVGAIAVVGLSLFFMMRSGDEATVSTTPTAPATEDTGSAQRSTLVAQYIAEADADFAAGRLISPDGDNALDGYQSALRLAPDDTQATQGMARLIDHYLSAANAHASNDQFAEAERNLQIVDVLSPNHAGAAAARTAMAERELALRDLDRQRAADLAREEQQLIEQLEKEQEAQQRLADIARQRRLAEQQQEAERQARLERERRLAEQRQEAERQARLERERRLAEQKETERLAKIEAEPRPVQPQPATSSRSGTGSGRPDLQVASQMISRFKAAFEGRDARELERVAELSPSRRQFVNFLFRDYARIEVEISEFAYLQAQQSAFATMTIRKLVTSDGNSVAPRKSWQVAKLALRSRGGQQWDKIRW